MGNQYQSRPGGSLVGGPSPVQASPAPGKQTLIPSTPTPQHGTEDKTYLADGAACENPMVGACVLDSATRGRLIQLYIDRVTETHSAFRSGCAMAYTDVKLAPDSELPWWIDIALSAGSAAIGAAVSGAIKRFGKWAAGAKDAAYDKLFSGEFVSERRLALYGAAAKIPVGAIEWTAKTAMDKGKGLAGKFTAGPDDKAAGELLLRLLDQQASIAFDSLKTATPAQVDDVQLLALYESLDPQHGLSMFDYKDMIGAEVEKFQATIGQIGRHVEADSAGGHKITKAAVWISDGTSERLAMVEHDDPRFLFTKGDAIREVAPSQNKFLGWVDDPTYAKAAEQLTRDRGNGNIGHVDIHTAETMLEGFHR